MDLNTFLRRIPKAELHCHLEGAVKASTFVELAAKHSVVLPPYRRPEDFYVYDNMRDFLRIYALIAASLRDREDFHRITYEALADAAANGLRYSELYYSPVDFVGSGVAYPLMLDGIIAGVRDAEQDLGIECRLIACLSRMVSPSICTEMVQTVLDQRREEVIGIGIGGAEPGRPPEWFVDAYRLAAQGGLHRTAHACEDGPAVNVQTCIDLLGCERIDHGYHVLEHEAPMGYFVKRRLLGGVSPGQQTRSPFLPLDCSQRGYRTASSLRWLRPALPESRSLRAGDL